MTPLNHYMQDGANNQARAVLCLLQGFTVEQSWNKEFHRYDAEPNIARWQNCREQGYVITLRAKNGKCLNLAFFEHRNSDDICALKWEQSSINSPTIETADFGSACYSDKFDVSKKVGYGKISEMSDWLGEQLVSFWVLNLEKKPTKPKVATL